MLDSRRKYLQIAFNRSYNETAKMVAALPASDLILVEAGTPFIKQYGEAGIKMLRSYWAGYIVADLKCMDRGATEVAMAAGAGANAATCLAWAPIPTIDAFIAECAKNKIDSMVDMMNVDYPFEILQKLKKLPTGVVLHRAADEADNKSKMIPYAQINRIRGAYNVVISIAGGENFREAWRTYFNGGNVAVVWRAFYDEPEKTAALAQEFLKKIER